MKNDQIYMIWIDFDKIFRLQKSELTNFNGQKSYDQKTATGCYTGCFLGRSLFIVKRRRPCGQCESRRGSLVPGGVKIELMLFRKRPFSLSYDLGGKDLGGKIPEGKRPRGEKT